MRAGAVEEMQANRSQTGDAPPRRKDMTNLIKMMHQAQRLHEAALLAYYVPTEDHWKKNLADTLARFDEIRALYAADMEAKK